MWWECIGNASGIGWEVVVAVVVVVVVVVVTLNSKFAYHLQFGSGWDSVILIDFKNKHKQRRIIIVLAPVVGTIRSGMC